MKILIISHFFYPSIGGIEVNSEILAKQFSKIGHQVRIVTWTQTSENDKFSFEIIRKPGIVELVSIHKWSDIVFENNPALRLSWPALLLRKPVVVAINTSIKRKDGLFGWQGYLKIAWLRRAKEVIAVSDAIRKDSFQNSMVIGNPYRAELFHEIPEIEQGLDFVILGRLVSEKGSFVALNALSLLNERVKSHGKRVTLTFVGDGPELKPLQKEVSDFELEDCVSFVGSKSGNELVRILNRHKYMLVPSICEEAFGNVVLEGMACGCLPIVSNIGGLPEAAGKVGVLFEVGDSIDLADKMDLVLNDFALSSSKRSGAPKHLSNHLPEVVAEKYLSVLNRYKVSGLQ